MAKTDFKTVDEYIAMFPADRQAVLKTLRAVIRKAVPQAEEVISYQIPAYKLQGSYVIYFSMFAKHFSLAFPPPFTVFTKFERQLADCVKSKSVVQFPLDRAVPEALIAKIAKFRADEIIARSAKQPAAKGYGAKSVAKKTAARKK